MKGIFVTAFILAVSACAAPRYTVVLREAVAAEKAGDQATFLARIEEGGRLRPDSPRLIINLARAYTTQARPDDALAALQRLADMGLKMNVSADPRLAPLKDLPRFQALATRLDTGPDPVTPADEAAFALTDVTGIIECGLLDPATGHWYFSDVRNRCIWRRDAGTAEGRLTRLTSDQDGLDGFFKLVLSPDRQTLWASTATVGVMTGPDAEDGKRSALVALDFATGRVRARYPVPADGRPHLLGDFILASDGSLYASDSFSPVIWRLPPGGESLEPWLENDEFFNLQGLAFDPAEQFLYVADYSNGLWSIPTATRSPVLLTAPDNATFFGIDGLYAVPGALLAVQNGVNPQRLLRIMPANDGASPTRTVASGRPAMTDLGLGQVLDGRFHFVGNSGWALFDPAPETAPPPREVVITSIGLE
jgi:sugar lactone lactonase YvrE